MADPMMSTATGSSLLPEAGDNSVIEGALTSIEQAIADIRADIGKSGAEEAPVGPAGGMSTPSLPAPAGGKNSMKSFLGA